MKTAVIKLRLSEEEAFAAHASARRAGMSLSAWVRMLLKVNARGAPKESHPVADIVWPAVPTIRVADEPPNPAKRKSQKISVEFEKRLQRHEIEAGNNLLTVRAFILDERDIEGAWTPFPKEKVYDAYLQWAWLETPKSVLGPRQFGRALTSIGFGQTAKFVYFPLPMAQEAGV